MTPKLIEPGSEPDRTREVPIEKEEFLIGRGADCDLRLNEEDISRHHALIHVRGHETTLSDLGSSNGTYVNGQRVTSQMRVKSGDEIRLGDKCRLIVDLGDVPGGVWQDRPDPLAVTIKLARRERSEG